MNRLVNTNLDKQMRKIEKREEKAVKVLTQQRRDLIKAIQDNEKLIEQHMAKGTPAEIKLENEIEKLAKVCWQLLTTDKSSEGLWFF